MTGALAVCGAVVLNPRDTVATALRELRPGESIRLRDAAGGNALTVTVHDPVPAFHKLAILPLAGGEAVIKYGEAIGKATRTIRPGEHVHTHNLRSVRGEADGHRGL